MAIVFTQVHPLSGAPVYALRGTLSGDPASLVPIEGVMSEGVYLTEKRNGLPFALPDQRVDRALQDVNTPGRRPPTEYEIQEILKCDASGLHKSGCYDPAGNNPMCFATCSTDPISFGKGLRRFRTGSNEWRYYEPKTGMVVINKVSSPLSTAYDFIKDNICWVAAGVTVVASRGDVKVTTKVKTTCDQIRAALKGSGGAPAPGGDAGAGGGVDQTPKKDPSWISQHPVATGAIAVGGMGAVGAVLLAIFRR